MRKIILVLAIIVSFVLFSACDGDVNEPTANELETAIYDYDNGEINDDANYYEQEDELYENAPIRVDIMNINGVDYEAAFFGEVDISEWSPIHVSLAFWRLENAYADFTGYAPTGSVFPSDNFPMPVEIGQIFVLDFISADGKVTRQFFRSGGMYWQDREMTEHFNISMEPLRTEIFTINGVDYEASFFGAEDISWSEQYATREFWRLENAYEDFADYPMTGNVLPFHNFPMAIEIGQVLAIDYIRADGTSRRELHRSRGYLWEETPVTEEIRVRIS